MSLRAFASGCNIIAYEKNGIKYGMTCAWSTMIDYGYIAMLLGSQSATGNNLKVGDIVGVSALAAGQEQIALQLGGHHSDKMNKFKNIKITCKTSAILIDEAKTNMVCKVVKILHLIESEADNFVVMEVLESSNDSNKHFMPLEDVLPE